MTGLSINEGATFTVSWVSERGGPTGSSRQIGISAFQITLDASAVPPSIAALAIPLETITINSAEVTADVTSDGGAEIVARGFVYAETSENNNPTIGGTGVTHWLDPDAETGAMSASLTGLNPQTTYSVRAYAENSAGIAYTAAQTFTTLDPPISFTGMYTQVFDDFDGALPSGWSATADVMGYNGDWGTGTGAGFRGGVSEPGVLGYQHTAGTGTLTINVSFINDTGEPIESLDVSYLGRVARISEGRSPEWTVSVDGDPVPALSYSTDNTAGPEDVPGDILVSTTVTGLNIQDGESFTITWVSDRGEPSGASRQIGIADVSVSVNGDVEPPGPGIVDVTDFSAAPGEPVRVSFVGAAGVAYQLQYTTDLTADPVIWTPVDGARALGDGVTTIVLEDNDLSDTMRIYRLVEGDM